MFDIAPTELLLVGIVALLVIGPKDLPRAMRFVGQWVGRARGVARQFRSGIDTMIRESELAEMEQQWKLENERIMREHPVEALPAPQPDHFAQADVSDVDADPVMVEQPVIKPDATQPDPAPPVEAAAAPKPKRARKPGATVAKNEPQP